MLVVTIRSDKPEAEVGLYDGQRQLEYQTWLAHRKLSVTLHSKIKDLLAAQGKTFDDVKGIVGFAGPGSFTGLRIGLTVANALAYGLGIPVVATKGEQWQAEGITRLESGERDRIALPEYGAAPHITQRRK